MDLCGGLGGGGFENCGVAFVANGMSCVAGEDGGSASGDSSEDGVEYRLGEKCAVGEDGVGRGVGMLRGWGWGAGDGRGRWMGHWGFGCGRVGLGRDVCAGWSRRWRCDLWNGCCM